MSSTSDSKNYVHQCNDRRSQVLSGAVYEADIFPEFLAMDDIYGFFFRQILLFGVLEIIFWRKVKVFLLFVKNMSILNISGRTDVENVEQWS